MVFGQGLVSIFTTNTPVAMPEQTPLSAQDVVVGTGDVAETGDRIIVHYTGHFIDGKVFDSSVTRGEPFQFVLGSGAVIKGWDQGIVGMRVGGKRTLTVPPQLAYGDIEYGPIPAGSTLVFDIELLKVEK
ncbi:FKBP-type peptidyl-prolyl cis-trans isomerase [Patescibacteria group bacterium]|nr:FKBP-type peptidyl-prolyl cis-trans isomerase [Patescibacteria group bacterium]